MTEEQQPDFCLGQRVVDDEGNRGTVRYLGPVASAKDPTAAWVGVEWDDSTRGKHDGSVVTAAGEIVRHFTCVKPGLTSASFLKPNKLNRGTSFMAVLHRRYVGPDAPLEAPNQVFEGAYANTSKGGQKAIEFLGEKKIRARQQIGTLTKVSMRGEHVAWAGEEEVQEASHLVEVDVQGNLWSDWEELGKLARQLPRLEILHLNSNLMRPLQAPVEEGESLRRSFLGLRVLVLNNCGLSGWKTVMHLEECLPCLEEVGLARNEGLGGEKGGREKMKEAIEARRERTEGGGGLHALFHKLKSLDLSGTGLGDWREEVALFMGLPELRILSLNENEIEGVGSGEEGGGGGGAAAATTATSSPYGFKNLQAIHLSYNRISSWSSIDALTHFPSLTSLRFASNPLTRGMGQGEARQLLIARVPTLTRVNGAEISVKERIDAERSYIRRVNRELNRVEGEKGGGSEGGREGGREGRVATNLTQTKAAYLKKEHPRWLSLVQQHGEIASWAVGGEGGGAGVGTGTLAKGMMLVTLVSMASGSMTLPPVEKKIPGTLTVGQLKLLFSKLFKLEMGLQVLYYKSDARAPPSVLDEDEESLGYFGLTSGSVIYMNERDLRQEAREDESRREAERERMEAQLEQVERLDRLKRAQIGLEKQGAAAR